MPVREELYGRLRRPSGSTGHQSHEDWQHDGTEEDMSIAQRGALYFPSRISGVNVTATSKPSGDMKRLTV